MPASICPCLLGFQWSCNSAINRSAPERQQDSDVKKQQLKLENLDLKSNFSGHQSVHLCNWGVNDNDVVVEANEVQQVLELHCFFCKVGTYKRCCRNLTLVHVS